MRKADSLPFYEPLGARPVAIAHRGGNAANVIDPRTGKTIADKQNTLAAFESAAKLGFPYIETDVATTVDGELVTFHGSGTPRQKYWTTPEIPKPRVIDGMTFAQTREILIGGEQIPILAEALASFPEMRFFVDPKTSRSVEALARVLAETNAYDRVCVGAFSEKRNREFAEKMAALEKT